MKGYLRVSVVQPLRRLDAAIAKFEAWALTALVLAMTLLAAAQVIMRDVFNHGMTWADVTVRLMVFWVGFVGASLAAFRGRHLAMDLMTHYFSPRIKPVVGRFTDVLAALVAALFAYEAVQFLKAEGDLTFIVLPLGFGMVSLRFLLHAIEGGTVEEKA